MIKTKKRKVDIDKIAVSKVFTDSHPNPYKLLFKAFEYVESANIDLIYVDSEYRLVDGYCTYLIFKALRDMGYVGYNKVKVCVLQEDKK